MKEKRAKEQNRPLVIRLVLLTLGMFGFGFALVPLYDVFCDITGINGKTADVAATPTATVDESREVVVEFIVYVPKQLPWRFTPEVKRLRLKPGETRQVLFEAENQSAQALMVQAVPSVSPGRAANHLKKVSCFCFEQQNLAAGEQVALPLIFYLDPELPENVSTLTLAYTLFAVDAS